MRIWSLDITGYNSIKPFCGGTGRKRMRNRHETDYSFFNFLLHYQLFSSRVGSWQCISLCLACVYVLVQSIIRVLYKADHHVCNISPSPLCSNLIHNSFFNVSSASPIVCISCRFLAMFFIVFRMCVCSCSESYIQNLSCQRIILEMSHFPKHLYPFWLY